MQLLSKLVPVTFNVLLNIISCIIFWLKFGRNYTFALSIVGILKFIKFI